MSDTAKALRYEADMIVRTFDQDASITASELADTLLRIAADIEPKAPENFLQELDRQKPGGTMLDISVFDQLSTGQIGKAIRIARRQADKNLVDTSDAMGCSISAASEIEHGRLRPTRFQVASFIAFIERSQEERP